jgi:hypothetical protein
MVRRPRSDHICDRNSMDDVGTELADLLVLDLGFGMVLHVRTARNGSVQWQCRVWCLGFGWDI